MDDPVYVGNAGVDGPAEGGWLLGHFMPPVSQHAVLPTKPIGFAAYAVGARVTDSP
ncbi:hypothetical protein [Micromonospora sp. CA-111912]|uniref:hypothetical protein n=1 Tax=Micromonospora sp. CA-111912 TaxID=3239955 RepID=UPI003D946E19